MMISRLLGLLLGVAAVSTALAQTVNTRIAPKHGWLNDLDAGMALAKKTGKPLMVVFRCDP